MVIAINDAIPAGNDDATRDALDYMQFEGGAGLAGEPVDVVFIGSCTNSRMRDLREAAALMKNRKVAENTRVLVVPGSEATRKEAEAEGLDRIFVAAGAEWREPGCSMCLAMNGDSAEPGDLVVSTSNRNFKGRQGRGVRTILASPLTAAASAITGRVTNPLDLMEAGDMSHSGLVESRTFCLPVNNIDTDQIIPGQFLTTTEREGLGKFCFYSWRYDENGNEGRTIP